MSKLLVEMEKTPNAEVAPRVSQDNTISDDTLASGTNEKTGGQTTDVAQIDPATVGEAIEEEEWEFITGWKLVAVLGTVTLACFTMLLDTSIVVTAIPRITSDFHSLGDVGWYGSAYLLSSSALQPLSGKMYAEWSTKWTFVCFLAIFELGSLLCGVSTNSNFLIIGRAVAGMGASGLMNGSMTLLTDCIPVHKQATYLGLMISIAQLGILLGPLIGGALTEYTTWRWCFYINLPLGALSIACLILVHIPDRSAKTRKSNAVMETLKTLDFTGFLLFAPTMIMFLLALEWGGTTYPWNSPKIIGLFCGSGGALGVFLAWEHRRGDTAMIPLSMVRKRVIYSSMLNMFFFMGSMLMISYYLAIYFQAVKGVSPMLSGVYLLPSILSQMIFAIISGVGVGKLGYYLPWSVASGAINAVGSGLLSTLTANSKTAVWVGYQIIVGVGRGCGLQMPMVAISNNVETAQRPIGMALVAFGQSFGGTVWLAAAQTAFSAGLKSALREHAPEVSPLEVATAGATGFRAILPASSIPGVIIAYQVGVSRVCFLATACAVGVFLSAWGMGWKSVKQPKVVKPEEVEVV